MTENNEGSTQFQREGRPAFPVMDKGTDQPGESLPPKTDTTQTPSQGGEQIPADANKGEDGGEKGEDKNRGFADDPRWQERESDWKNRFNEQETRHVGEMTKLREEMEAKFAGLAPKASETKVDAGEIPPWFNGDEQQWADFVKFNDDRIASKAGAIADEKVKGFTSKQESESKAVDEATKYFNTEVAALEADKTINPKGEKIDRNKLLKTALDNDLVDSKGRWNYKAAYRILQQQSATATTQNNKDRKDLAGATVSGGKPETKSSTVTTSDDFSRPGGRPW